MIRKRNKYFQLALVILLGVSTSASGQLLEKLFVGMPVSVDPLLGSKERMEMVEYRKNGLIDTVQNQLGGSSYLLKFDTIQNSIIVKNTANSLVEYRIFPKEFGVPVVGVINTVQAPVANSSIRFYDFNWRCMSSIRFSKPISEDWLDVELLRTAESVDTLWVRNLLKMSFVTLKFEEDGGGILAENQAEKFLSEADAKIVAPFLIRKLLKYEIVEGVWVKK